MSQYYLLVNLDKKQCFPSLIMDGTSFINICGQKLSELVWNRGIKPFLVLLLTNKGWNGDRLALVGTYSDHNPYLTPDEQDKYGNLFEYAHEHFDVVHPDTFDEDIVQHAHKSYIITNGKQYLDPLELGDEPSYAQWLDNSNISTGLVILLGYSSGSGWGDLNVSVGDWAGDGIQIVERNIVDLDSLENISADVLKRVDKCMT